MRINFLTAVLCLLVALTSMLAADSAPAQEQGCVRTAAYDYVSSCGCSYCAPPPLWIRAEYLHAWINNSSLPALISTSSSGGDQADAGVLGEPGTSVLFGDEPVGGEGRGVRATFGLRLGHYFDSLADWQVETTVIWLGSTEHPDEFSSASGGDPILAQPFFDTSNGAQNSGLVAFPGLVAGSLSTEVSNEVNSAAILVRRILHWDDRLRLDLLAGYRYFNYSEQLDMEQAFATPGNVPSGEQTYVAIADRFRANNRFDGLEVGAVGQYYHNAWEFEALGKLAFGQVRQTWTTDGATIIDDPGQDDLVAWNQGFLATSARIGVERADGFAVLPELNLSVRRHITPDFIFTFGYTLIYLNDAIRLGGQLNTSLDSRELADEAPLARASGVDDVAAPSEPDRDNGLWIQGIHIGLEW